MEVLLIPFLAAFLITAISTPFTIKLAKKYNLVEDPNKKPHPAHIQKRVIPKAGGLPIYFGLVLATAFFIPLDKHIIGIILAVTILLVTGLIDDYMIEFSPFPRLVLQILAAAVVVASGVGITFVNNPLGGLLRLDQIIWPVNFYGTHNIIVVADIFAFFWIVWMMNMVNWSWGVDGQMPGIIAVAALTIGLLANKLFLGGDSNQLLLSILAFITAGAALGILIFNWHPAKILPGDSASNILGFMIAVLSILSGAKLAIALLVLLVPATDFFYTFFRRIASGHSPFLGDQKHFHHLLLKRGWSPQKISLFYILSCVILALLAVNLNSQGKLFTALGLGVATFGSLLWLHLFSRVTRTKVEE